MGSRKEQRLTLRTHLLRVAASLLCGASCAPLFARQAASSLDERLVEARNLIGSGQLDAATRTLQAALVLAPRNPAVEANLGAVFYLQNRCGDAIAPLRTALETDSALPRTRALLALCSHRVGAPDASALLQQSFNELDDAQLKMQVGLDWAGLLYQQEDMQGAAALLNKLLQLEPENIDALFLAQRVYSDLTDGLLTKLALLAPHSARMEQVIASHLINTGEPEKAILHYREALKLDPQLSGVHLELGQTLLQLTNTPDSLAEARQEFLASLVTDGDNSEAEAQLGAPGIALDAADALRRYQRSYELDPSNSDAAIGVAKSLMTKNQYAAALPYLEGVVHRDPLRADARYRLFTTLQKLGRQKEAAQQLRLFRSAKQAQKDVAALFGSMNRSTQVAAGDDTLNSTF